MLEPFRSETGDSVQTIWKKEKKNTIGTKYRKNIVWGGFNGVLIVFYHNCARECKSLSQTVARWYVIH